ncbi:hypothetical protein HMPREF9442_02520 [Paraprevotella xylaniphila YIT 11841]|uniref:Uncharacterized protein n=1 Tax=Paraprevotella xylaniphila YIT 11841 TaxID=762982 RepID=F3QWD8_9BACT|nr:hypothetical protein HMPREF9442_02520 [Paraprevotella xylaniphila YIT 11841]
MKIEKVKKKAKFALYVPYGLVYRPMQYGSQETSADKMQRKYILALRLSMFLRTK